MRIRRLILIPAIAALGFAAPAVAIAAAVTGPAVATVADSGSTFYHA